MKEGWKRSRKEGMRMREGRRNGKEERRNGKGGRMERWLLKRNEKEWKRKKGERWEERTKGKWKGRNEEAMGAGDKKWTGIHNKNR